MTPHEVALEDAVAEAGEARRDGLWADADRWRDEQNDYERWLGACGGEPQW